jgi:hypothetical protein
MRLGELKVPRLVGKQSNNELYAGVILGIAIIAAVAVEYLGIINVVPGFGRETDTYRQMHSSVRDASPKIDARH